MTLHHQWNNHLFRNRNTNSRVFKHSAKASLIAMLIMLTYTTTLWPMQKTLDDPRVLSGNLATVVHVLDESVDFLQEDVDYNLVSNLLGLSSGLQPQHAPEQSLLSYTDPVITASPEETILMRAREGIDGRTRIRNTTQYPYCCFGRLTVSFSGQNYAGSAVAVGPNHLLTAAHCVTKQQKWPDNIMFYSGLDGKAAPFGEARVVRVCVPKEYFDHQNKNYDVALLVLDRPLGLLTGYLGCLFANDVTLFKEAIAITGYPADKGWKKMWSMAHKVKSIRQERIHYDIDTYGGQSGSPIWSKFALHEDGTDKGLRPLVIGIHTHGEGIHGEGNSGIRLTEAKFKLIMNWIALTKRVTIKIGREPITTFPKKIDKTKAYVEPKIKDPTVDQVINAEGFSRLHKAAQRGDLPAVTDLIDRGANVNLSTSQGDTPLHLAANEGHDEVVSFLLRHRADVTLRNKNNCTPLHLAAWKAHRAIVRALIKQGDDENSVLFWAAQNGNVKAVDLLIECGAHVNYVDTTTSDTPLHAAIYGEHAETAKLLIKKGAHTNKTNKKGYAPIHYISLFADLEIIKVLVTQGTDVNLLLHWAAREGKIEVAEFLISRGANVHWCFPDTALTPLFWAVIGNHTATAKMLLDNGAKINVVSSAKKDVPNHGDLENYERRALFANEVRRRKEKGGRVNTHENIFNTPRIECNESANPLNSPFSHYSGLSGFERLREKEWFNTTTTTFQGRTSLFHATANDHVELVKELIGSALYEDLAVTLSEAAFPGCTLLHLAVIYGHAEMAELLIDQGAELNAKDSYECTPLHYAVMSGFTKIAELLLYRGAGVDEVNCYGETPLCCLRLACHEAAVSYFYMNKAYYHRNYEIWINRNMEEMVHILGTHKANFNMPDSRGHTPLHLFAFNCPGSSVSMIQALLEHGADPNKKNSIRELPVECAHNDAVKELLKKHTDSCTIC